ncbi:MAG: hypothetical protein Q8P20_08230 [bacterium]|nr:hypothetical protein [bacterium]
MTEPTLCNECSKIHKPGVCPKDAENNIQKNLGELTGIELTSEQEEAAQEIMSLLEAGKPDLAGLKRDSANMPAEFFNSDILKSIIKKTLIYNFSEGYGHVSEDILDRFELPVVDLMEALKEGVIGSLNNGLIENAVNLKKNYNIGDDIIYSSEVQLAVKEGINYLLTVEHLALDSWQIALLKNEFGVE